MRWIGPVLLGVALISGLAAGRAAAEGEQCAGLAGLACADGEWCDPSPGMCETADATGACVKLPAVCAMILKPVCGCDGRTYGNDCERRRAKIAKRQDGPCR